MKEHIRIRLVIIALLLCIRWLDLHSVLYDYKYIMSLKDNLQIYVKYFIIVFLISNFYTPTAMCHCFTIISPDLQTPQSVCVRL